MSKNAIQEAYDAGVKQAAMNAMAEPPESRKQIGAPQAVGAPLRDLADQVTSEVFPQSVALRHAVSAITSGERGREEENLQALHDAAVKRIEDAVAAGRAAALRGASTAGGVTGGLGGGTAGLFGGLMGRGAIPAGGGGGKFGRILGLTRMLLPGVAALLGGAGGAAGGSAIGEAMVD